MTTIGTRVAHLRENLGLKQKEFAVKCGISPQNISNIEGGDTKPSYDGICAITKAFPNVNITWLIHGEGDMFSDGTIPVVSEKASLFEEKKLVDLDSAGDTNFWRKLYMEQSEQVKKLTDFILAKPNPFSLGGLSSN